MLLNGESSLGHDQDPTGAPHCLDANPKPCLTVQDMCQNLIPSYISTILVPILG